VGIVDLVSWYDCSGSEVKVEEQKEEEKEEEASPYEAEMARTIEGEAGCAAVDGGASPDDLSPRQLPTPPPLPPPLPQDAVATNTTACARMLLEKGWAVMDVGKPTGTILR